MNPITTPKPKATPKRPRAREYKPKTPRLQHTGQPTEGTATKPFPDITSTFNKGMFACMLMIWWGVTMFIGGIAVANLFALVADYAFTIAYFGLATAGVAFITLPFTVYKYE